MFVLDFTSTIPQKHPAGTLGLSIPLLSAALLIFLFCCVLTDEQP